MRGSFASTRLSNVAHIEMGQSPDSSTVREGDRAGVPFLQGNAEFGAVHPTPRFSCTSPMKLCRAGDLLLSVRAPVGAMNIADRDYCIGRGLAAVRIAGMSSTLAAHMVSAATPALRRVAQGTTFEAISKTDLASLVVTVPPYEDREPLGCVLDAIDTTIRQTEAIIEKLKQVKHGLLHDLLTRGVDTNGELRPPQRQSPQLYKHSSLGWIPKEWTCELLEKLSLKIVDGVHQTPSYVVAGEPFVTIKNLTETQDITFTSLNFISPRAHREYCKRADPRPGDVLVTKDGTLGVARLVRESHPEFSIFVSVAQIRPLASRLSSELLLAFFDSEHYRAQMGGLSGGSGLKHIHLEQFRRFKIPLPAMEEQSKIAKGIASFGDRLLMEVNSLHELRQLKSGLMDDLLTGRVRVTPLLEPAAACT